MIALPCWFDPTIKIGDLLIAGSALLAAWWVARVIAPRDANERVIKDLVRGLCGDLLTSLAQLSDMVEACPVGQTITETSRHSLMGLVTGFSNGLMVVDEAVKQWGIDPKKCPSLADLMKSREGLRSGILDPLVAGALFDGSQIRQIHGEISKTKLTIITFQLQVIKNI